MIDISVVSDPYANGEDFPKTQAELDQQKRQKIIDDEY